MVRELTPLLVQQCSAVTVQPAAHYDPPANFLVTILRIITEYDLCTLPVAWPALVARAHTAQPCQSQLSRLLIDDSSSNNPSAAPLLRLPPRLQHAEVP